MHIAKSRDPRYLSGPTSLRMAPTELVWSQTAGRMMFSTLVATRVQLVILTDGVRQLGLARFAILN
jgi:hypothetical protein